MKWVIIHQNGGVMESRYIGYYRVSTTKQGDTKLGLLAQQEAVMKHANGYLLAEFTDIASGKSNERPELLKAIEFAKQHDAVLVIAKLDRLSRSLEYIFRLRDSGVRFICCDMPDANTLTIGIIASLAQHERELIADRTKAALLSKKRAGWVGGNDGKYLSEEGRAKSIETRRQNALSNRNNKMAWLIVQEKLASGHSLCSIAKQLNDSGFLTSRGKQFSAQSVKQLRDLMVGK
jgi:DNA invertase Pin-like site-specific DNA recombinase